MGRLPDRLYSGRLRSNRFAPTRSLLPAGLVRRTGGQMKINPVHAVLTVALVLCFATATFGQRTTGDLEGKVTDPNGAVVPNVSITLTGVTAGFKRTVQSNDQGEFRIQQVPIGTYKITTAALSGFAAATVENISVSIEKVTTVNVKLGLTATTVVVDVSASDVAGVIDPAASKV